MNVEQITSTDFATLAEGLDKVGCESWYERACCMNNDINCSMFSHHVKEMSQVNALSLRRTASATAFPSLRSTWITLTPSCDILSTCSSDLTTAWIFADLIKPLVRDIKSATREPPLFPSQFPFNWGGGEADM